MQRLIHTFVIVHYYAYSYTYYISHIYIHIDSVRTRHSYVKIVTCNSVDKIANAICNFMLLNTLFTDAKVSPAIQNTNRAERIENRRGPARS